MPQERLLTTHTGSLARPAELRELLFARDRGEVVDRAHFDRLVQQAVRECVRTQVDVGLDIVNDGEMSKISFANYVRQRLAGFAEQGEPLPVSIDAREFPDWATRWTGTAMRRYACTAPVTWTDFSAVESDIANLRDASADHHVADVFLTAVSPGTLANFFPNHYYGSREAYLEALADVMRREYRAIVDAGFLLQLDCPDLALHDIWFPDLSRSEFRTIVAQNVAALNRAIEGLPTQRVRMHVCWGAGERPLIQAVPLAAIVDLLLQARVGALSIVGANGRHEHEWRVWHDVKLPDGMLLIPGVVDNTSNIVEHPEVVAERLMRYASVVGKDRVIGGVDCGFATGAGSTQVDGKVAWAKLRSLVEGARLASPQLWAAA
ncbi:MAG: cobalamin-independent methionine synthase II family protein [Chloroflexi bacterium]|nr:cobalamin-independent methionine synthase II family protein [Chloroflexota bacterium]